MLLHALGYADLLQFIREDGLTRIPVVEDDHLLGLVCFNKKHSVFCVYPS